MLTLPDNFEQINTVWPRVGFLLRAIATYYRGGRMLDVGCGNGRITKRIGDLGVNILGIDLDAREIATASASTPSPQVHFACQNLEAMGHETFAGVMLTEVLEHVREPLDFLKTIAQVCEPGGFLVLTVPNGFSLKELITAAIHQSSTKIAPLARLVKWYRKMARREQSFNESQHVQWFTLRRIRSLIHEAGFTIREEAYFDVWSELLWVGFPWLKMPMSVKRFERRITPYLPHYCLEDWGFVCQKR